MSATGTIASLLSATLAVSPALPLTAADIADLEPAIEIACDTLDSAPAETISDVETARRAIAASLDALREGRPPRDFFLGDEVYDALAATGELEAWTLAELELGNASGVYRDEADCDDVDLTEQWFTCGHDPAWLDAHADDSCEFMLGAPEGYWAYGGQARGVLFVSVGRFKRKSVMPRFQVPLGVDSGGFITLTRHGRYRMSHEDYVAKIRHIEAGGGLLWAASMDHMCEDAALRQTGLTLYEHQRRTVESFLRLRALAPEIRWLPVLQGQAVADYLRHVDMYRDAGVDLTAMQRVGVGSICRRTRTQEIDEILDALYSRGLRLHMFGGKSHALRRNAHRIRSADSMAWSKRGQWKSCTEGARDSQGRLLQNSPEYAEAWRVEMNALAAPRQHQHGRVAAEEDEMHGRNIIPLRRRGGMSTKTWNTLRDAATGRGASAETWGLVRAALEQVLAAGRDEATVSAFALRNLDRLIATAEAAS